MDGRSRALVPAVVGLLAIAMVAVGGWIAVDGAPWSGDEDGGGGGTADNHTTFVQPTGAAELVDPARISVVASSHLPPADTITYVPENAIDGDPTTAWNSDSATAQGRGEELTFRFAEPVDLKALRFVNGYAKSDDIFSANHRLRDVMIHTDQSSQALTLLDTSDPQEINFDFGLTSKVRLEVIEVYPGDGFANPELTADLALSEVSFLAVQR